MLYVLDNAQSSAEARLESVRDECDRHDQHEIEDRQNEMNRSGRITLVVAAVILLYVGVTMPLTRVVAILERRVRNRARV